MNKGLVLWVLSRSFLLPVCQPVLARCRCAVIYLYRQYLIVIMLVCGWVTHRFTLIIKLLSVSNSCFFLFFHVMCVISAYYYCYFAFFFLIKRTCADGYRSICIPRCIFIYWVTNSLCSLGCGWWLVLICYERTVLAGSREQYCWPVGWQTKRTRRIFIHCQAPVSFFFLVLEFRTHLFRLNSY